MVGDVPAGITYDPANKRMYVDNRDDDSDYYTTVTRVHLRVMSKSSEKQIQSPKLRNPFVKGNTNFKLYLCTCMSDS